MTTNTKSNEVIDKIINANGIELDLEMIEVPAGSFMMGSEKWKYTQPVHKVTFDKPFFIGKYPVTQRLWKQVMGENNNPSRFKGDSRPVEMVSWDMAKEFINKINKYTGKTYRLPSESEWEYAARGGKEIAKENLTFSGSNRLKEVGWYNRNSLKETKPVGLKMPNQLGIHDMSGNVREWCEDKWNDNYDWYTNDGSPFLSGETDLRVVRGGSWYYDVINCSVFDRGWNFPDYRTDNIGFRLARY